MQKPWTRKWPYAKAQVAEAAHNARCKAISAQYARQPSWTAQQIAEAAFAAEHAWKQSVAVYHRERAA